MGLKHPFMIEHLLSPEHTAVNEIDQIPDCRETQRDFGKEVVLGRLRAPRACRRGFLEKW